MNLTTISIAPVKEAENNFKAFPATGLPEWERAAKEELQGAEPWKKLTREVQGVEINPFCAPGLSTSPPFHLPPSQGTFLGPRTWYNCPLVIVRDPKQANAIALEHLEQGANGIYFELAQAVDFSALLRSITWSYCSLNFLATQDTLAIATGLERYLATTSGLTHGALFGPLQNLPPINASFRFIGIRISSALPPIEALADGIIAMDKVLAHSFKDRCAEAAFSVEIGTDFFLETSKLRALRAVWQILLTKRGATSTSPLFIHAWSRPWTNEAYAPHGNMIKATTAAMASILGGCDVLTIDEEDPNNATMNRAARNVSNVLREESHFSRVADPLAGSYFIDDLTKQLTEKIWSLVETKIRP